MYMQAAAEHNTINSCRLLDFWEIMFIVILFRNHTRVYTAIGCFHVWCVRNFANLFAHKHNNQAIRVQLVKVLQTFEL